MHAGEALRRRDADPVRRSCQRVRSSGIPPRRRRDRDGPSLAARWPSRPNQGRGCRYRCSPARTGRPRCRLGDLRSSLARTRPTHGLGRDPSPPALRPAMPTLDRRSTDPGGTNRAVRDGRWRRAHRRCRPQRGTQPPQAAAVRQPRREPRRPGRPRWPDTPPPSPAPTPDTPPATSRAGGAHACRWPSTQRARGRARAPTAELFAPVRRHPRSGHGSPGVRWPDGEPRSAETRPGRPAVRCATRHAAPTSRRPLGSSTAPLAAQKQGRQGHRAPPTPRRRHHHPGHTRPRALACPRRPRDRGPPATRRPRPGPVSLSRSARPWLAIRPSPLARPRHTRARRRSEPAHRA
jgi:hypothetical protein